MRTDRSPPARVSRAVASGVGLGLALVVSACRAPHDYGEYLAHMPQSIVVLPPLNESPEVEAPYIYLATVTRPLAERGYYVFPVAVVDHLMKENGLPTPGEMHQVPLERIGEIIGADAVLYVTIREWGTSYVVIDSRTVVRIHARLVDVRSGITLWEGDGIASQSSSQGASDPIGLLIGALVHQVVSSMVDATEGLSRSVNFSLFGDSHHGLLLGDDHPDYAEDQELRRLHQEELRAGT